ncbi:Zinc uptake regulation protein [Aliiroseovarius sp. xm-m-379]|nr:Zinc uptake regulation protein [Aliiroseovarius sp. xm-d-517]NRP24457.1 Zinc uptake regulation protein [Aliiroseovarius sp. xm-m-379]NRP29733.1 Zinc uptake regulation protein [Aliiroseovarius sp. xm-m-314]NRP33256.1 Zinc uptake regulation protein [Aliiroseovarius sp. xm-a-104]NRP39743.1 Zinc uptake regulation protein [Aliiroseovarius sp. xm-m-339-2]NRP43554.1 Zinc uptake regulation protein [Aliiroseovarius sp. xm-m-378]NRP49298.1 Zinc uptake regulation protein [Aliiroseovarius sp. xm-m-354
MTQSVADPHSRDDMATLGFAKHDHHSCIHTALEAAQAHCAREGLQLTPVRKRVLEILLDRHTALGAYEILDMLRAEKLGSQPPVAYRALDFLVTHGFAHKIERLNAFIACAHPDTEHAPVFLICRACQAVAETHTDLTVGRLGQAAGAVGFAIERMVVEVEGLCPNCQDAAA